jgi:ABC-type lipoprotein export system ATPase subunit/GNAT superfamily N-acetyltransferase
MPGALRMTAIARESAVVRSARVLQLEGIFDVPPSERTHLTWNVELPIDEREWHIGLITGPSGCGKTTIARSLFPDAYVSGFDWPADAALIDAFPPAMSIRDITLLLSSVGFSSPPSWVRPFGVLSNGEQFRSSLARALAERTDLCVFDEFTSVVDRTVAQIGSAAVSKTVRRRKQKFIAVTCHDDVVEWLDPDWIYTPVDGRFQWRLLRRRPAIELAICRVPVSAWTRFAKHHYLTASHHKGAVCFAAFLNDRPVAFDSWLPFVGKSNGLMRRGHRTVCLPDYQGVGIGNALFERIAAMWRGLGYRVISGTGHPALLHARAASPHWRVTRQANISRGPLRSHHHIDRHRAADRLLTSFEFVGTPMQKDEAERQLNCWAVAA